MPSPPPLPAPGAAPPLPVRRVVLLGAESTGKTTLAERLAAHYGTTWTPEYVRAYVAQHGPTLHLADVARLAEGHLAQAAAARPHAHRVLFLDTDLLSTVLYSHYYFGTCPAWVEAASYRHHADLYLLTAADVPWTADPGQRDGPAVRAALQPRFRAELVRRGLPFVDVAGPLAERLHTAVAATDRLLHGTPPA